MLKYESCNLQMCKECDLKNGAWHSLNAMHLNSIDLVNGDIPNDRIDMNNGKPYNQVFHLKTKHILLYKIHE